MKQENKAKKEDYEILQTLIQMNQEKMIFYEKEKESGAKLDLEETIKTQELKKKDEKLGQLQKELKKRQKDIAKKNGELD